MHLFLSLLALPVVFASHIHHTHHKRASDAHTGDKTFSLYDAGLGACGGTNTDSDFIVALNVPEWDNGANCYKEITITYNGKTTQAQIVDECDSCPDGGLDLSRGLFTFFEDPAVGIIHGDWSFVGATTKQPITTTAQKTTTTTTSHTSTTTSASATEQATTSTTTSKTSSSSSASASASTFTSTSTTATSSSAVATPTSSMDEEPQVMAQFSDTLVNVLGLIAEAIQVSHA